MKKFMMFLFGICLIMTLFSCAESENGNNDGGIVTTYTVIYDGNGATEGSVPVDTNNYEEGDGVVVLGNTGILILDGYTFLGWNTVDDGSGIDYPEDDIFIMGGTNVILYAIWILNTPQTDAEAVVTDKGSLEIIFGGSDSASSVTQDLTLPSSGSSGTTIVWSSGNTSVIANDGTVARPAYGSGNTAVVLSATITKGSESDTKDFILVVTQAPANARPRLVGRSAKNLEKKVCIFDGHMIYFDI